MRNASILKNSRDVFNICGNKYRIIVLMDYARHGMLIRFVGTHEEYDEIGDIEKNLRLIRTENSLRMPYSLDPGEEMLAYLQLPIPDSGIGVSGISDVL